MTLLQRVERLIKASNGRLSESKIGRDAVSDPCLIRELRAGRSMREVTRNRLMDYLLNKETELGL